MGKLIKALNSFDEKAQYSFLSTSINTGGSVIYWDNNAGFRASWAIQLGQTGQEKTEVLVLGTATPAVNQGTVTGTALYPHNQDTPIYAIFYDKLIFKRNTSGTSGTATPLTDGTIPITPDSKYTTFYDSSGEDSYYYKVSPYNSVLAVEGKESDWISFSGYDFYSLKKIRDRSKGKIHNAKLISDSTFDDWTNEWLETMNNVAIDVNKDYSLGTAEVGLGTAGFGTVSSSNFVDIRKIEVTWDGTNYFVCTRMDLVDFVQNQPFIKTHPYYYYLGDNKIGVKPDGVAGTALIHYYTGGTVLTNDTDTLPVVMRPYSRSFVDYNRAQAAYLDNDNDGGDRFMRQAEQELERFRTQIAPRHKTGTKYIDLIEPVDGENSTLNYYF